MPRHCLSRPPRQLVVNGNPGKVLHYDSDRRGLSLWEGGEIMEKVADRTAGNA